MTKHSQSSLEYREVFLCLLELFDVKKMIGDRTLFEIDHFSIYDQDRIGIVGLNGSGKTTFMKLLIGEDMDYSGQINHFAKMAYIGQLTEEINVTTTLSGGERTIEKIRRALDQQADLLLADEPTSHLDLEATGWVETQLTNYPGAVVLISHDRTLLNKVCTKIIEINGEACTIFTGNYEEYRTQKQLKFETEKHDYDKYTKEKARLEDSIHKRQENKVSKMHRIPTRFGRSESSLYKGKAKGKVAKVNQGITQIQKRLEMLDVKEKPKEEEQVTFDISYMTPIHGKSAIRIQQATQIFGGRTLFNQVNWTIRPGDKCAFVGNNGSGKTTLLKMIQNQDPSVSVSQSAKIGYYAQDLSILDESKSIFETVKEKSPFPEPFIRTILARLLFRGEDVHKQVADLSGGERVKVALATLFLGDYNILLLDEPTNYLDLFTKEQLEEILAAYPGTLVFATHDRYFLEQIAQSVLIFQDGRVEGFRGRYAEYLKHKQKKHQNREREDRLKTVQLHLTEVLSRLSLNPSSDEKAKLEVQFESLVKEKHLLERNE